MKNLLRVVLVLTGFTMCLEQAAQIGRAVEIDDMEYHYLKDRAKERAERTRNKVLGRSPAIGSNHENNH